jgi:amino acid adenylation domain-containing protein
MTLDELLVVLGTRELRFRSRDGEVIVSGDRESLDGPLLDELRAHKPELLRLAGADGQWWSAPAVITPDMLPLVDLTAEEIERIVSTVPGGVANVKDIYPLAPLQDGILFHHLLGGDGDPYLLSVEYSFDTRQRLDRYLDALRTVVDRHDILRTAIVWEGVREPVQVVLRHVDLPIEEVALEADGGDAAEQFYARFNPRRYRLDVRQAPMLRIYIAQDPAQARWLMLMLRHHLTGDHTTSAAMRDEIEAYQRGDGGSLPDPIPFRNLVAQARLGVSAHEHEAYFRALLADVDEPTAPFGLTNAQGDGTGIEQSRMMAHPGLARRMRTQARRLGVSTASLCHVAWAQVLARVSGRDDVVFGTVLFGRMQGGDGSDRAFGVFMNTLPVRIGVAQASAETSVRQTQIQLADLLRHEHASLALAQRCSGVRAPAPLFTSLLNYRHSADPEQVWSEEQKRAREGMQLLRREGHTSYPLMMSVDDMGERLLFSADVQGRVEPARVCGYMHRALESLVEALERGSDTVLRNLEVLPDAEWQQVVHGWNATTIDCPRDTCVHDLFEAQVRRTPDDPAVEFEDVVVTYAELNARANRLAHYLRERGVGPDQRVAVGLGRGVDMVVALLGVLKAGGAYVPLDPEYPEGRLQFMIEDSAPVALLTEPDVREVFANLGVDVPIIDLGRDASSWRACPETDPHRADLRSDHLVYVIYTSGSTGTPKGVMMPHRAMTNLLAWQIDRFGPAAARRTLQFAAVGFDVAFQEIFGTLCAGGSVILLDQATKWDPVGLFQYIKARRVQRLFMPYTGLHLLADGQPADCDLQEIIIAGEQLRIEPKIVHLFRSLPGCALENQYGPTETHVVSAHRLAGEPGTWPTLPPIGTPVANTHIYILDDNSRPVPCGVPGELYLGGAQVARGYWNRPELTSERFLRDPFTADAEARMYRTGDLGQWLPDGTIEFLGRNDFQVKIRGFRVELGEIEARLSACAGVSEAVVVAREDTPGGKRLVAYYTSAAGESVGAETLRAQLSASLPEYMVPSAYVRLESLPQTPNGKLDRKALPAPGSDAYAVQGYEAPIGEVETAIAEIWADVLKVDRVGRQDNFFALGGHSLLAVTLVERLRRQGFQVDVRTLFATPQLADLAATARSRESSVDVPESRIPTGCLAITPDMLPLIQLTQAQIDRIVAVVPGGAANVQDIYPLAPLQEGMLFHHLISGDNDPYLLPVQFSFDTRERLDEYVAALRAVIDRHDILRTALVWDGVPEPVQVVHRRVELPVEEVTLDRDAGDAAEQLYARFDPRRYRIDVRHAPMLRIYIAQDPIEGRWLMLVLRHHLTGDHTTFDLMRDEIEALVRDEGEKLPQPVPFRNLVAQVRLGVSAQEHEAYFRRLLGDVDEATAPFGLMDVHGDGTGTRKAQQSVDEDLARRTREQARRLGVSTASLCHVAWAHVLARVSGRHDVVFGTVLFGRMQGGDGADRGLGLFMNTLPVRIGVGQASAETSIRQTQIQLADVLRHEHASLVLAQRCSGVRAPAPLFTSLLNYRYSVDPQQAWSEAQTRSRERGRMLRRDAQTNYPLIMSVDDMGQRLSLTADVQGHVDPARVCGYMHRALESLVEALESGSEAVLPRLTVLPAAEREQVLFGWNATAAAYPHEQCLHELFEAQVQRTPEAPALVWKNTVLTYAALNARANRLAHTLRGQHVGPDERVGICMERSVEMVVALLGVLKAGGAYVPLEPSYPIERLRFMVNDSAPTLLLTQRHLRGVVDAAADTVPIVELGGETEPDDPPVANPPIAKPLRGALTPRHLAYVIYTSGSTGTPKGVMVEHRGVVNRLHWMQQAYGLTAGDAVLQKTPFTFDVSVWEFFWPLLQGARLLIAQPEGHKDPSYLCDVIRERAVTTIHFVPSMLQAFLSHDGARDCTSLARVVCSGEALPVAVARQCQQLLPGAGVHNLYGPTEASVDVTAWTCPPGVTGSSVPIGRPIANTQIYILDEDAEPTPIGVAGEVCIGGVQVARGYWNRPELTAERFVRDPFVEDAEARMYRTGDLGRWLPDGTIEFLGRNDFQVKVRGFRIELGEIEARLRACAGVADVVVIAREDTPGEMALVAYYTSASAENIGAETFRVQLSATLPEYMVPAAYVRLESLPLTPNGKLDRKALPEPGREAYVAREYEAPVGEVETTVAHIWAEVLKVERVGRRDHFFDLGGHSLLAVQVTVRLRDALGVEVALKDLFAQPVLAEFARGLERATRADLPPLLPADRRSRLPVSFAQQRVWFLAQMEGVSEAYHMPLGVRLRGPLDRAALRRALDRIVERHEMLRTRFVFVDGEPEQRIVPAEQSRFALVEHDLRADPDAATTSLQRLVTEEASGRFDLEQGPVIRGRLIRLAADEHVLLITMHHIASDGWSMGVLRNELRALYGACVRGEADPLPPLPLQYADYAVWQRTWMSGDVWQRQAAYWATTLKGAPAVLPMPTDHPRSAEQMYAGGRVPLTLDASLTARLRALSKRHGTTLYMTLLAAWAALLARLSGESDVVIGTPVANRSRVEVEGLIGFFLNTLAIRIDVSGSPTVGMLLARAKAQTLAAQQHQDLPFEQVVEILSPVRSLAHSPVFQVMFAWQASGDDTGSLLPGLDALPLGIARPGQSQFDVTLSLHDAGERIEGGLVYATSLFERATIERYLGYYVRLLGAMVEDVDTVDRLPMLPESERKQLLQGWNATAVAYPRDTCIHQLFEAQVARTPHARAVVHEEMALTYAELNTRANQLAHYLRACDVGPDRRVAICIERGLDMVVALLGVWKAGGAYVPLDPSYPDERLRFMLDDSAPVALLTDERLKGRAHTLGAGVPVIDVQHGVWGGYADTNPDRARVGLTSRHLAYVMYTSGSTGAPKGVMVEHRSVVNFFTAMDAVIQCQSPGIWLAVTSPSFDISVLEMFWTLTRGFEIVLRGEQVEGVREQIARAGITHMQCTPSMARLLLVDGDVSAPCPTLEAFVVGGEALSPALAQQLRTSICHNVINMYGPTETTIWSSSSRVLEGQDRVSIGAPVANTQIYVLDPNRQPVPTGVTGELYIGGAGVARGYLNRPELTTERFVRDPFVEEADARMYRTGDLGRWLPDGTIEFLGRTDFQVKIRGFRIEPGEIEARLRACAGVSDAVVVAREDTPGDTRLVAYYTSVTAEPVGAEQFRAELAARLPEYMVPSAYVRLESFPLTPNGKLDRKALPEPGGLGYARREYEAPIGEVETTIAATWAEVLHVERVGRRDNFFALGGHSLLAVTLVERLRREGLQVDVRALFATPELADLAAAVRRGDGIVEVPENRIPAGCDAITPDMLPLITLTPEEIDHVVSAVPGGAPNVQDIYPLAPLQEGILFHHLLGGDGDPYLASTQVSFDSREHLDRSVEALRTVIARHDILRTAVVWEGLSQPVQVVHRRAVLLIEEVTLDPQGGPGDVQLHARFDPRRHRIDVRHAPMLRVYIAPDPQQARWLMLVLRHHLTGDRITGALMQREMDACLRGEVNSLPAPLPFRNLVAHARLGIGAEEHATYFRTLLGDVDEPTAPFGLMDVRGDGTAVQQARLVVDADVAQRLRVEARKLGVSPAILCHVAWAQVLARIAGRDDVVFGTVLFGRMHGADSIDRALGMFINTLPVRIRVGHDDAKAIARQTQLQLAELLRHEHASLTLAQRCSRVPAPAPLFTSLLNYRHGAGGRARSDALRRAWEEVDTHRLDARTNYPVVLAVDDWNDGFGLSAQVNDTTTDPARICGYMHRALSSLVDALDFGSAAAVRDLEVLPESERQQLLREWNATAAAYPREQCIHELFEAQVRRTPEATAVVYEETRLSYRELNAWANQLAYDLRARGVGPDARVGICLERSLEMMVALLGVLKAGGAYVPLDPSYPEERLRFMVDDSAPVAVLTQGSLAGFVAGITNRVPAIDLGDDAPAWRQYATTDPDRGALTPNHLAYVIYTSGSTGTPKGVMNQHQTIVNRLWWGQRVWPLQPGESILGQTSLGFDNSVRELLWPLMVGAQIVLAGTERSKDPKRLIELIRHERISTLNLVPSLLKILLDDPDIATCVGIVRVLSSGEALPPHLLARFRDRLPQAALHNVYGPSEAATAAAALDCTATDARVTPSIGRPIANTQIYILDAQRAPVPVGVMGELYIGGAGVARGYLNRPELTSERFMRNPFVEDGQARIYRTGDVGRWLPDGTIELVGRNDFQVKIRGFRIELGEIEARLRQCVAVDDVVVVAREDTPGEKRLVVYYTSTAGEDVGAETFRAQLSATLPDYMVPSAYVRLDVFPLTPSGKLDRQALPAPGAQAYAVRTYEAPVGEVETTVAAIWVEVLQIERVGRRDNFFALGGHSLLAVTLVERLRRRGLQIDVRALFATPELADLSATVRRAEPVVEVPENRIPAGCDAITPDMLPLIDLTPEEIERIVSAVPGGAPNIQDIYPLAPLQEGILFHHLLGGDGDPYLLSMQLSFDTRERVDRYVEALRTVIARHDILRTAVMWEGLSQPVQVVQHRVDLPVEEVAFGPQQGVSVVPLRARFDPRRHRIDVRHAPMLRIYIAQDPEQERWLMLVLRHHLTGDHTTGEVMHQELTACLRGAADTLPAPLQFRSLVAHARLGAGTSPDEHETYFRTLLGDVEERTAPFGLMDVRGDGTTVQQAGLVVDADVARRLRAEARKLGISAAILCHVAWAQVLARVSGRDDVVFGTVLFGRMHGADNIDRALGVFINTLPVRIRVGADDVRTSVRQTQLQLAELLRHEQASLALAQRCSRVPAPAPLFTSLLNYRYSAKAEPPSQAQMRAWEGIQIIGGHERTNYPLILSVDDRQDGFALKAQVDGHVHPAQVCGYMHQAMASLVEALEHGSERALRDLEVLPEPERRQLLHAWNATATVYPHDMCVHELFETHVSRTPEATAVVYDETRLSYRELNTRANQLAHDLRARGVGPDERVGVCLERSIDMAVALLAVLKAGAAYVPMDPSDPTAHLRFIVEDSAPAAVVTQPHLARFVAGVAGVAPVIELGAASTMVRGDQQETNPDRGALTPNHVAYVIYTSGSTETPTGVMVDHRGVVNRMLWMQSAYALHADEAVLQKTPFTFDVSVWEFFWPLSTGARLVIARPEGHKDLAYLCETIRRHQVTTIHFMPSMLEAFIDAGGADACSSLVRVICGGEPLSAALARRCQEVLPAAALHHLYGPADSGVDVAAWTCRPEASGSRMPIGRPIANTHIYILDASGAPTPIGVTGELYIGGAAVPRGYWNRPALTAKRFVRNPFVEEAEARMYRTGDLGRWLPDGTIELIGRSDRTLDRQASSDPGADAAAIREYEPPIGDMEIAVAEVWADVLQVERVGRRDDFFALGGLSLSAVQVMVRLRQALGVEAALKELFAQPVLVDFARSLDRATRADLPPLVRAERRGRLPLSFAQQRLWFLSQIKGGSEAYHEPFSIRLRGALDRAALWRALDRIVERHEVLRTRFVVVDGEPEQQIVPVSESRFTLVEHDLRTDHDAATSLRRLVTEEAGGRFDLAQGPVIRGRLIRLADDEHVLLITMHHIASDGWSMGVLRTELRALYGAYSRGDADPLPALPVQYADYAVWQRTWMADEVWQRQVAYWTTTLRGAPALLPVPSDHVRPAQQAYAGEWVPLTLDATLTAELRALSKRHGTTLYMTLLAAWAALLARLSGESDVVIGTPVANRSRAEVEGLIGFFVNTLAIRIDMSGAPTVGALLARVKAQTLAAQQHQDLPFEQVVEILNPVRSMAHSPVFQVMLAWQTAGDERLSFLPGLEAQPLGVASTQAKFDLTLSLHDLRDRIIGGLGYATSLFERATIERYLEYLRTLLRAMVAHEAHTVDRLPMLPDWERQQLLDGWNATATAYPQDTCVHTLFEAQVRRTPEAPAVEFAGTVLTYAEVNTRANRLAHYLVERGVGPDARVAICLEPGLDLIVALLAALKAGAGYVPLDPAYPASRLQYMVQDSAPVVLLTEPRLADRFTACRDQMPVIDLGVEAPAWRHYPATNLDRAGLRPDHLVYVLYTSGSTGMPKGVMMPHRAMTNLLVWEIARSGADEAPRTLQFAAIGFDLSFLEIFTTLCGGGTLVLIDRDLKVDPRALYRFITTAGIQRLFLPYSALHLLADATMALDEEGRAGALRTIMTTAEQLRVDAKIAHFIRAHGCTLDNQYGPTETHVVAAHRLDGDPDQWPVLPPIGRPIANTRMYVLDDQGEPVPVGVPGELFLAGVQVARGYLNRPALTAERFLRDPFVDEADARMYRTGDLARWLPDGTIEYLGRNDFQVKIRGFRIELGEIEAQLNACAGVAEAVVVAREEADEKRLVAYYTSADGESVGAETLRAQLSAALPDYMVPSAYVRLESLPLTPNGKLDRKALPAPGSDALAVRAYEAPVAELETAIAAIFADVLKVDRVGRSDNFFALGGHSLSAVRVVYLLREVGVDTSVLDVFIHPSPASFAEHIASGHAGAFADRAIRLRRGAMERPLFFVHDGFGQLTYATMIAPTLDVPMPLYGLPGQPEHEAPLLTVEAIVTRMVRLIRAQQPFGPYRVAGWSYGGVLAYEIAARLLDAGDPVEFLGMFDSDAISSNSLGKETRLDDKYLLARWMEGRVGTDEQRQAIAELRSNFASLDYETLVKRGRELSLLGRMHDLTPSQIRRDLVQIVSLGIAMWSHRPQPIAIPVHLFVAEDHTPATLGWIGILTEAQIRAIPVPGTHLSMMDRPHVDELGRALAEAVRTARNDVEGVPAELRGEVLRHV